MYPSSLTVSFHPVVGEMTQLCNTLIIPFDTTPLNLVDRFISLVPLLIDRFTSSCSGRNYYVDHLRKRTAWKHPLQEDRESADQRQQQQNRGNGTVMTLLILTLTNPNLPIRNVNLNSNPHSNPSSYSNSNSYSSLHPNPNRDPTYSLVSFSLHRNCVDQRANKHTRKREAISITRVISHPPPLFTFLKFLMYNTPAAPNYLPVIPFHMSSNTPFSSPTHPFTSLQRSRK